MTSLPEGVYTAGETVTNDPRVNPIWGQLQYGLTGLLGGSDYGTATGTQATDLLSRLRQDDGPIGGIYRGIFGATAGDTTVTTGATTATGEPVPVWVWVAAAVVGGAVIWRAIR